MRLAKAFDKIPEEISCREETAIACSKLGKSCDVRKIEKERQKANKRERERERRE